MTHALLERLLADVDAPVRRVVLARGVEACRAEDGSWRLPPAAGAEHEGGNGAARAHGRAPDTPAPERPAHATLAALGLRPIATPAPAREPGRERRDAVDPVTVGAQHGLAPLLLVAGGGASTGESTHLVSAAGAIGWRPPLERLYDDPALGGGALRLRFLLDAIEHHAVGAAEAYAAAAHAARRTAGLFGTSELTTLAGQTALFVELDALLSSVGRAYLGGGRLLAAAFPSRRARDPDVGPASFDTLVLGARSAPAELRERLLEAWESHGAHARAYRRALRRRDAVELGRAPVQLARLADGVWAVSVPVPAPPTDGAPNGGAPNGRVPRRRVDALERAWAIATDAMRVVSLVVYAASER